MPESFRERVDTASAIKGILDSYPYGNGLAREIIQNSDDAGATQQILTLDCRQHPTSSLVGPALDSTQGPALLCENDSVFRESDWTALRTIHGSNKKSDESKIGKYGLGFRSCYHITDNPHILSAGKLVVFDPHEEFAQPGGIAIDICKEGDAYPNQLSAFHPSGSTMVNFSGTIIRLPLRTPEQALRSRIMPKSFSADDIRGLFHEFMEKELGLIMLFLKHIHSIELREISPHGVLCSLGKVYIEKPDSISQQRAMKRDLHARFETFQCTVVSTHGKSTTWRICHSVSSEMETAQIMSSRLGYDTSQRLSNDKLFSHVALAYPLQRSIDRGRLFTLLPLPIYTDLPLHLHAILALTPDRQALRNREETGAGNDSRERLLIEWNLTVFDTFAPRAWAHLLAVLVEHDETPDIWSAWPDSSKTGNLYWENLPRRLALEVAKQDLAIFPKIVAQDVDSGIVYVGLRDSLVASVEFSADVLRALAKAGLVIIQPPLSVLRLLKLADDQILTRSTIHHGLQARIPLVEKLEPAQKILLLDFLLGPYTVSALHNIVGLPLVPTVSGTFVALSQTISANCSYTLATNEMIKLFRHLDPTMIDAPTLTPRTLAVFLSPSSFLNVAPLPLNRLQILLEHQIPASMAGTVADPDLIQWTCSFWTWVEDCGSWLRVPPKQQLHAALERHILLLTTAGQLRAVQSGYLAADDLDNETCKILRDIGVPLLDKRVPDTFLRSHRVAREATDVGYVLDTLNAHAVGQLSDTNRLVLQAYFATGQRKAPSQHLSTHQLAVLKELPVFPILLPGSIEPVAATAALSRNIVFVKTTSCPLPSIHATTFVDVSDLQPSREIALLVDNDAFPNSLDEIAILRLAVTVLANQTDENMDILMSKIVRRLMDLGDSHIRRLKEVAFVLVEDGTRHVPSLVVDPYSSVQPLFEGERDRIPAGPYAHDLFPSLQLFRYFLQTLTASVVHERIRYISARATSGDAALFSKAVCLLTLLASQYPQLSSMLQDSVLRTSSWMPTTGKCLCKPEECRSASSTEEELLFDLAVPLVAVQINSASLRKVLGWAPFPSLEVILDQMRRSLELAPPQKAEKRLRAVIGHLGTQYNQGLIAQAHLSTIAMIVAGKAWIPVGGLGVFARTHHAVLSQSEDVDFRGSFRRVHRSSFSGDVIPFLKAMGCEEMPTLSALVEEITTVVKSGSVSQSHILQLLEQCSTQLSSYSDDAWPSEVDDILIPVNSHHTVSMAFQPLNSVHYDDLPAFSISSYSGYPFRCHSWVSKGLARGLKIPFASDLRFSADGDGDDLDDLEMSEDFCSRISGVLKDYDINYAINEFIANAVDAGATRFSVYLDERSFGSNVLSPDVARFQGPALLLYNNALFEPKDFDGIRNVGTGGKTDEADTIGRFGLGALSLFHFTDLPTIVSGGKAMLLDPSGEYLPRKNGNRRTSIHRTIDSLCTKYPDQMAPFKFLEGFSTKYYPGTVFRLPLRKRSSKLSSTSISASDVLQLLQSSYLELASSALMFTGLERVNAGMISPDGDFGDRAGVRKPLWSVVKHIEQTRSPVAVQGYTVQHDTVLITMSRLSDKTLDKQHWFISRLHYPVASVPSEHTMVLERHKLLKSERGLRCGLAFALIRTDVRPPSYLFSTMRLPVTISLPAHVDAQFALSSDRRSLRHDPPDPTGHRVPEAQYNNWVLNELIPLVYHYSLAHIGPDKYTPWVYWPTRDAQKDEVSLAVVNGFFGSLMKTNHTILPTPHGHLLKPSDAVVAHTGHPPHRVCTVLTTFRDSNLIQPPPFISLYLKKIGITLADPQYVRDTLALRHDAFYDWCTAEEKARSFMESVLSYLLDAKVSPSGLPLLRLQDRSIVDVPASSAMSYYIHDHDLSHLFPANRFLSSKYSKHSKESLVANCPGISNLTPTAVNAMINEKIGASSRLLLAPPLVTWVRELWRTVLDDETMPKLDTCSTFAHLPLFRTHDDQYISLHFAKSHAVLPPPLDILESWTSIAGIIDQLGIIILPEDRQNKHFVKEYFSLAVLVQKMTATNTSLNSLGEEDRAKLARWIRREMSSAFSFAKDKYDLRKAYRSLPVWPAKRGVANVLVAAEDVVVLPRNMTLDLVQPYLVPHVAFSELFHDLKSMDFREKLWKNTFVTHSVNSIDANNIHSYLQLPDILSPDRIVSYKALLTNLLDITSAVQVPDGNLRLRPVTDLYDDNVPLLMSSLCERPEYSVYIDFRDLRERLLSAGLRHTITPDVYETCVRVLDGDLTSPRAGNATDVYTRRANLLFSYLKEQLPLGVSISAWNALLLRLRGLRFIPQLVDRRDRVAWDTVRYSTSHPLIVAPQDVVLLKDSRVCWTQYVLCDETSMHAVLFHANPPTLGMITVESVVAHLLVLTRQVAEDHAGDTELLGDISATYRWLEDHNDTAKVSTLLARHSDDAIFLNVDDPRSQQWTFLPASALVFGLALDENGLFTVREYLSSRKALLKLAGVQTLSVPAYRPATSTASTDATIRVKYDEMRLSGKHCDVVFEPTEGDIPPDSPERLRAHISFLAANVPHLDQAFESGMSERATGRYRFKGTFFGAHAVLDFIYTEDIVLQTPQTSEELGELLGALLDLLETADAWNMPRLIDHVGVLISRHELLTPETNATIHKDAQKYRASQLVALCEEFAQKNSRILPRLG